MFSRAGIGFIVQWYLPAILLVSSLDADSIHPQEQM
jgi:hypothetical protein